MSFAAQASLLTETCFGAFGEDAIYRDRDSVEIPTRAVIDNEQIDVPNDQGPGRERRLVASLPEADVPRCVKGDILTIGTIEYQVDAVMERDRGVLKAYVRSLPSG